MNLRMSFAVWVAVLAACCGHAATDYYVDAVNGNDANTGLAPGEGNAKESFAALFAAYTIKSGDKVHAAAGIYTNGVMLSGSTKFRLVVPAGVEIIGAGADVTAIWGQAHTNELGEATLDADPWGCGANAIRGVYLNQNAILRKFTIAKGYAPNYSNQTGGGVLAAANAGLIVDCVVTNCAAYRGALANGTAVRCRFENNRGGTGCDIFVGAAFNCLFGNCKDGSGYNVYQGAPYVNCTFYGSGQCMHVQSGAVNVIYNSLVLKGASGSNTIYSNCIYHASKGTAGGGSTYISSDAAAKVGANYRPLRDSPCLDVGDLSIYTSKFPAALADEMWTDFLGNARKAGASIDAGACESPFTTDGAFDWHVDAVNGSDANDGTSAESAFQNLSMALTNANLRSGDIIHAAPGLYTNGVMTQYSRRFRAAVPSGVTLIGDGGAEETVIVGAKDEENGTAENFGCGPNAVSCVFLGVGAKVKGFTLTGGRVPDYGNTSSSSGWAGAVFNGDNRSNVHRTGFVVDCIVTNNYGARAAGCMGGVSIRCRFADNWVSTSGCDVYAGVAYDCLFGDVGNTSARYNTYAGGPYVNCTFIGAGNGSSYSSSGRAKLFNCLVLKDPGIYVSLSNCVYTGSLGTGTAAYRSRKVDSAEAGRIGDDLRARRGSPALDAADATLYTPDAVTFGGASTDEIAEELRLKMLAELGKDIAKAARVQGLGLDIGAFESSATSAGANWYVNAEAGDDANDGTTADAAFKTFAAAMTNAQLCANDVVNVAAGVYSSGTMAADNKKYRVVVPEGVTLLGAGADTTVIEGAEDRVNGTEDGYWCGPDAVACVRLNAGAAVRGFTLTKGHSPAWESSKTVNWGGAVVASDVDNNAYVIDCVVSNNFAGRGAGLYQGTAVRCRFGGNGVLTTGTDIMQGRAYNCIFGSIVRTGQDSVYQEGPYVNCVFHGAGNVSHIYNDVLTNIWNSIVLRSSPGSGVRLVNCATTASAAYSYEGTSMTLTEAEMMLDENYAPRKGSPLIDRGRSDLYATFPADVAAVLAKTDFAGTQRIYNGAIDIGAFEYDWRGDFARRLRRSRIEVVQASELVVTNGVGALTVPAGSSLEIVWRPLRTGIHTFRAAPADEGALATLTLNGETLAPAADGVYTFVGEKDTAVTIAVASDEGQSAVLRDFAGPGRLVFSFR